MSEHNATDTAIRRLADDFDAAHRAVAASPLMRRLYARAYGDAYPAEVEPYSSCTWWTLGQAVSWLRIPAGGTLIDVGCGRGGPGLWLARALRARLIGIDFSPAALELATARIADFQPLGGAEFRSGTFDRTGLPDAGADGIVCVDAVQFAPDIPAALREFRRILRPGGRVVFTASELLEPDPSRPQATTDWRPWIEQADLVLEQRLVDTGNSERWLALYGQIERNADGLRDELGDYATDSLLAEARTVGPRLPRRRPLLLVARRSRSGAPEN